jgi:glycosyltransferase involved in cell wall biosynthesis
MNGDKLNISVVVPVYNTQIYIERCITALLSQDYPLDSYEIVMVDNNSNDGSAEIIKRYQVIRYLKRNRQGSYAARNEGIWQAKGEIIALTDSDCAPSVDWLRNIEDAFRHHEVGVVLGRNQFACDSRILSMLTGYESAKADYALSGNDKTIYYGYTNNMAIRKTLFNRVGLFLEISRGADVIFVRRVVDVYGCDTVAYFSNINVRHLEISNEYVYLRKQYIYGRSFQNYSRIKNVRALTTAERLKAFRAACKTYHFSPGQSAFLLIILIIGAFCYELGRKGGHFINEAR